LAFEEEDGRVASGREIAVGEQARPGLVEVACEHLPIGAEVRVLWIAGRDRLPPRRREARDDRAGERLVLRRLDRVGAQVVLVLELLALRRRERLQFLRARRVERLVVVRPALGVVLQRLVELRSKRPLRGTDRRRLSRTEAERKHGLSIQR